MPYAELSDVRCFYDVIGNGEPVLLIPGLGTTCAQWDPAIAAMSRSLSFIAVDNRDIGQSVGKRPPQAVGDFACDYVELLDYLELDRVHVLGLSLGGVIAQRFAIDHPGRVDRLVLISTTHQFGPYLHEIARLLGQALRHFPPDAFRRTVELLGTSPEYLDKHADEMAERLVRAGCLGIPRSSVARQLRCLECCDLNDGNGYHIAAPTLVIAGENDMLIPACYARQMASRIAGSQFLLVKACGHNPFIEKPDEIVPKITDFLTNARDEALNGFDVYGTQLAAEATV